MPAPYSAMKKIANKSDEQDNPHVTYRNKYLYSKFTSKFTFTQVNLALVMPAIKFLLTLTKSHIAYKLYIFLYT